MFNLFLDSSLDARRHKDSNIFFSGFPEFFIINLSMFLTYLPFCLARGFKYLKCKKPGLISLRAGVALLCIWLYSISRVWTQEIDNSMLYSTDGFWVVLIMVFFGLRV